MKNNRLIGIILFISFILVGCTTKVNPITSLTTTGNTLSDKGTLPLTILTVNDLHGYIEQDEKGAGGISNLAYLINNIRNADSKDDTVLLANGDMFQGTAISNMTSGLAVLDCMNAMGFDAMGIGNHEFDWGIDTILKYFDNNPANGEATFPLINDNIYLNSDNSLLTVTNGNVIQSTVLDREGVQIAIISYIGNVFSSISYDKVQNYHFDQNIPLSVKQRATELRDSGADIVIVNLHGGSSSGITSFTTNSSLAQLKDDNGNYLVDAVINGHTHSFQQGVITRDNGVDVPVVQAGSYDKSFGKITLTVDLNTNKVIASNAQLVDVSTAGTHYDAQVQTIVDDYKDSLGNQFLAEAGETITSTHQLFDWTGNVMLAATGADIAISNTGGVRATGGITAGEDVTLSQMYEVSPFDNSIWLIHATYAQIEPLLNNSSTFYKLASGVSLNNNQTYTVAVISYVYYWSELDKLRADNDPDVDTGLYVRNILVDDLIQKNEDGQLFLPISHPEASIGLEFNVQ